MKILPGLMIAAGSIWLAAASMQLQAQNANGLEPFTASGKVSSVQLLANGTQIQRDSVTKTARDSSGRMYTEIHETVTGDPSLPTIDKYSIDDRSAHTLTRWGSGSQTVTVVHLAVPPAQGATPAIKFKPAPQERAEPAGTIHKTRDGQIESLGTQTIAGLTANGRRITRVIPAGSQGNDQPITVVDEQWRSPELGIMLMNVRDDPRTGKQTNEITEVERGEPDAALFQLPQGYTVQESTPHQQNEAPAQPQN